jgi:pimeloyl-ACP methyl ester carboxylesterase
VKQHQDGPVDRLSSISQPTLILWGKYDTWIPIANAFQFLEAIPNSELKVYDAGHIVMEEIPEATSTDVLTFLEKHRQ